MNYYERHLGDYARDTAHLSLVEHGAYTILLDRFYATEQGIPQDQAHRIARARTKEERAAVDAVLAEFFVLENGAYVQKRALGEIEKAQARIKAARENGRTGGRPKRNPEPTRQEPTGFSGETQNKALHLSTSPPSSLRSEGAAKRPSKRCPEDFVIPDDAMAAMRLECPTVDLERETRKFRDHTYPHARSDWLATWRNWIRGAVDMAPRGTKSAEDPEAAQVWERLIATDGAERSPRAHAALQAIGGWSRVKERTVKDTPFIRREFIAAYVERKAA